MRILFVSPSPPLPIRAGGQLAQYNVLRYLASRGHEVQLLCLSEEKSRPDYTSALREICVSIDVFPRSSARITTSLKHPLMPYAVASRLQPELSARLQTLCRSGGIDAVHLENTTMAGYGMLNLGLPVSITIHSLLHLNFQRVAKYASAWGTKAAFGLDALRMRRYERRIFGSEAFARYFFYSTLDMHLARARFGDPFHRFQLLPLGIVAKGETDARQSNQKLDGVSDADRILLLVGSMENRSNEDAARWFGYDILPKVVERVPNARMLVVGRGSEEKLADMNSKFIRVVGEVDDLAPYLSRAEVYVVPQRGGSGIRVKLLDGLAAGKVVVSTEVGVEAIAEIRDGEHYLLARDANEFAKKCADVLCDPEAFRGIADAGHQFVSRYYSVETMGTVFEQSLESLVQNRNRGAPAILGDRAPAN